VCVVLICHLRRLGFGRLFGRADCSLPAAVQADGSYKNSTHVHNRPMEFFLHNFDTSTACFVGALIVGMLAFMALAQVKQFPHYKIPFMSLACGLIFGSIGMGYLAMGIEQSNPVAWHFAHIAGTLSYFFIVISLIQLFRPDLERWKPSVLLAIALLGTLFFPIGVATVVWT
jgi:hypothetical protein